MKIASSAVDLVCCVSKILDCLGSKCPYLLIFEFQ